MSKLVVVDYDPAWPETFEQLRARIWPCLRDVAVSIEHVGSTSVRGLSAKPIIDMTIVVPTESAMRQVIGRLTSIGYRHCGNRGVPGREAFDRPPNTPDHHLYAAVDGNEGLRNHLAVRDYLRSNPATAQEYGTLKKKLAAQFSDDIDSYIDGKTEFLLKILARSGFTPGQIAAIREMNSKPGTPG